MLLLSTLTKGRIHDSLLSTCSTIFFDFLSGTLNHNSYNMPVYGMSVILKHKQSIMVVHITACRVYKNTQLKYSKHSHELEFGLWPILTLKAMVKVMF